MQMSLNDFVWFDTQGLCNPFDIKVCDARSQCSAAIPAVQAIDRIEYLLVNGMYRVVQFPVTVLLDRFEKSLCFLLYFFSSLREGVNIHKMIMFQFEKANVSIYGGKRKSIFIRLLQCCNSGCVSLCSVNILRMKLRKYYPTVVLFDIHLGSEHSKTKEVTNFLKHIDCDRLILVKLAQTKRLDGIICVHIHQAANVRYGNVHYLNSGDWVESMTALVENEQGEWNILTYNKAEYDMEEESVSKPVLYAEVI